MQDPTPLDPPDRELEDALASLALPPTGIAAETLWYQAGLARERRRADRWRAAAAIALIAAGAVVFLRPKPAMLTVDRVVVVREQRQPLTQPPQQEVESRAMRPAATAGDGEGAPSASPTYLRLRDLLSRNGPQSLPATLAGDGNDAATPQAGWALDDAEGAKLSPVHKHLFIRGG